MTKTNTMLLYPKCLRMSGRRDFLFLLFKWPKGRILEYPSEKKKKKKKFLHWMPEFQTNRIKVYQVSQYFWMRHSHETVIGRDYRGHLQSTEVQRRLQIPSQTQCTSLPISKTKLSEKVSTYFHFWKYTFVQKGIKDTSCHSPPPVHVNRLWWCHPHNSLNTNFSCSHQ